MLVLHEKLSATPSRQREVVERVGSIHGYMRQHPGFLHALVARYLGNPNEYLVMRWWRSAEDLAEHGRNPAVPNWGANRPEGIYLEPPKTTRWQAVTEFGPPPTGFLVRTIYRPKDGDAARQAADLNQHAREAVEHGVMTAAQVLTASDEGDFRGTLLLLAGFKNRDAFDLYLTGREGAALNDPNGSLELVLTGCFEVVAEVLPEHSDH
jgi:quinol monooxygenase YgiN